MNANQRSGGGSLVKNRAPAPVQITAEQIIAEARDKAEKATFVLPRRHIADVEELHEQQRRTRKEFEERVQRSPNASRTWIQYAKYEESQKEIDRARSVYERGLKFNFQNVDLWLAYGDMEIRNKYVNRARNVFDRAVSFLPRQDKLWLKYTFIEEMLSNAAGARVLYEKWMSWEPSEHGWYAYIKFESRQRNVDKARSIYERFIANSPYETSYIRYATWEEKVNNQKALARRIYERAVDTLRDHEKGAALYGAFAAFEERCGEFARARAIFSFGLEALEAREKAFSDKGKEVPEELSAETMRLRGLHIAFEKQYGDQQAVESVVLQTRRLQLEQQVQKNRFNYDAWLDLIRLEESVAIDAIVSSAAPSLPQSDHDALPELQEGQEATSTRNCSAIREAYERAISNAPPIVEKKYYKRYVLLFMRYALYEELIAGDIERAAAVYSLLLKAIPHRTFTFQKAWIAAAHCEVRRGDVPAARKLLGRSLGICPRFKVLHAYVDMERRLGETARARVLLEKMVELFPERAQAWVEAARFEWAEGERERARALLELALQSTCPPPIYRQMKSLNLVHYVSDTSSGSPSDDAGDEEWEELLLDSPETVWRTFIELEEDGEPLNARKLYERLLLLSEHAKIWISFAAFERRFFGPAAAREVFRRALEALKGHYTSSAPRDLVAGASTNLYNEIEEDARTQRAQVSQAWLEMEEALALQAWKEYEPLQERMEVLENELLELQNAGKTNSPAFAIARDEMLKLEPNLDAAAKEVEESKEFLQKSQNFQPKKILRKRAIYRPISAEMDHENTRYIPQRPDDEPISYEEYWTYVFNDENNKPAHLKLLELAQKWKKTGGSATSVLMGDNSNESNASKSTGLVDYHDSDEIDLDALNPPAPQEDDENGIDIDDVPQHDSVSQHDAGKKRVREEQEDEFY